MTIKPLNVKSFDEMKVNIGCTNCCHIVAVDQEKVPILF